jgi:hypothetical protein
LVTYIGEDGSPLRNMPIRPNSKYPIALRFVSSKTERYKTMDVYRGDVAALTRATFNIARDIDISLDLTHFRLYNDTAQNGGCFGAFSYEQGNADPTTRLWVPHSSLVTSHFPTTNDYDLTQAPGSASNPMSASTAHLDIPVLQAIMDYCNRWPDLFEGGALVPTGEILTPASDIIKIAEKFTPTANAAEQKMQEEINANGYMEVNYMGRRWKFIPNFFIQPGTCYPRFNQVPGMSFNKAGLDREILNTNLAENWEERSMRKVLGMAIPAQRRRRALRIKYASTGSSS